MSELPTATADLMPPPGEATAGTLLRKAREATGLHIAALAVAMKVPVKKLEALEADRLGELPDAVFVRALAGSVCRALKIDPAPVLSRLPQSVMPRLDRDERGINMPFQASGMQFGHSALSFVFRPAALWVIGLLAAALLVLYFPEVHTTNSLGVLATAPTAADSAPSSNAAATLPSTGAPVVAGIEAAPVPVMAPPIPLPASDKGGSDVALATVTPNAATGPAQGASAPADLLVFKAKSTAWVRVTDAKGAVQFEKTLSANETASATGLLPLAIVVGNVAATELLVRGQAFSLEEVAKNNVARFEVK
jgi:cytoskeleton protein RodZ